VRQIHRYLIAQKKGETQQNQKEQSNNQAKKALAQAADLLFSLFRRPLPPPWRLAGSLFSWSCSAFLQRSHFSI